MYYIDRLDKALNGCRSYSAFLPFFDIRHKQFKSIKPIAAAAVFSG